MIVKKLPITLPSFEEQRAIASALSDMDALLAKLDQLIAKKRDIKQAAMQELLTGRRRLPGFSDEWPQKHLSEICTMKSGDGITSERIDNHSKYPCYGGNGLRGYTKSSTHDGDYVLIGRQGALCGNITRASGEFFASEHAIVVTPNQDTNVDWLAEKLVQINLNRLSESSAQPGLSVAKILSLSITVPPHQEQTDMATALVDMASEITALEARREKTRLIKQGMMQELLSGRVRLI